MRPMTGLLVLTAALGIWAGYQSWHSPSLGTTIQAGAAIFIGANLLFMTVIWTRARPGSGEKLFLPDFMLLSVSMLVGLLPRLLWPGNETLQIGASVASVVLTATVVISMIRRNRRLRARPPG